jgi:DNA-binding Lrp family transcriptional regulator
MSDPDQDWREAVDATDAVLLDEYQRAFPVRERPFEVLGAELDVSPEDVLDRLLALREAGVVRRFGPVLNPPVLGSSTLAAVSVPDDSFDDVAAVVNSYAEVTHNYRRAHEWNMWFVVTAPSRERRDEILADIESRTGCRVLNVPRRRDYATRLDFAVVNDDQVPAETTDPSQVETRVLTEGSSVDLTPFEANLLLEIQDGFPLSLTPYRDVAATLGVDVADVVDAIDRLLGVRAIKRIGFVVDHRATGFRDNCMVAWDVPEEQLDAVGPAVGSLPFVTKCYHRPRRPDLGWNYTLFTMVHGREAGAVEDRIDELAADYVPYPHVRLPTVEKLKQTGARYEELIPDAGSR